MNGCIFIGTIWNELFSFAYIAKWMLANQKPENFNKKSVNVFDYVTIQNCKTERRIFIPISGIYISSIFNKQPHNTFVPCTIHSLYH